MVNPYIDNVTGGGERYTLTIAAHLSKKKGSRVDVIFPKSFNKSKLDDRKKELEEKFAIDLSNLHFIKGPFGKGSGKLSRYIFTKKYDVIYYLTDGSFFFSGAKKNIVYFQVPLPPPAKSLKNKINFSCWKTKVCNSHFTKDWLEREWGIDIDYLLGGSVDTDLIRPGKKENLIMNVGRFFLGLHTKRQDVLIKAFIDMCKNGLKDWRFILIGTLDPGEENKKYFESLVELSKNYPVEIKTHVSFDELNNLYGTSQIYWHATGFDVDQTKHPERVEHFGITVFESMAAGAVPVVIKKGGIVEIVEDKKSGFLWSDLNELKSLTLKLIKDEKLLDTMSKAARARSHTFSEENFFKVLDEVIYG